MENHYWNGFQAPVPLSIFRSNSKFDENSERCSFEYTRPITTIFCTRHDSDTVVTCVYFTLECFEFSLNFEFDWNMLSGTGARSRWRRGITVIHRLHLFLRVLLWEWHSIQPCGLKGAHRITVDNSLKRQSAALSNFAAMRCNFLTCHSHSKTRQAIVHCCTTACLVSMWCDDFKKQCSLFEI